MTNYEKKEFKLIHLEGDLLEDKQFTDCTFINCTFFDLTIKNCSFTGCTFKSCTCANITPKSTDLFNNDFLHCSLIGINWDVLQAAGSISLPFYKLEDCVMKYNFFVKMRLKSFSFQGNILEESSFEECNLEKACFTGCRLKNASFLQNNLKEADFQDALDYQIDLRTNILKKAKFSYPEVLGLLKALDIQITGI